MHASKRRGIEVAVIVASIILAVLWFVVVDAGSHSASDTLRPWLIGVIVIALVAWSLVALLERRSREHKP